MADDTPELPVKPRNKLILILLLLNLVAVGGTAVYFLLFSGGSSAQQGEDSEPVETESAKAGKLGPLVALRPLVVNLAAEDASHYLKAVIQLEIHSADKLPAVEASLVPIRDGLITHLSSLRVAEVSDHGRKAELHEAIVDLANEVLEEDLVKKAYFSEFVVQ
ncbi:MAG: flagellar basal body-associated FliL family protein [Proteobacteria bacterium]|nr:flagellar basal body-associated FliL family protein [Pseudomonadota bacterium]